MGAESRRPETVRIISKPGNGRHGGHLYRRRTGHRPTGLSSDRSPDWGGFERWFWSQAPDRLIRESLPSWAYKERLAQRAKA